MRYVALSVLCLIPSMSFAMFCPGNFNLINIGDSIDRVAQACGKPDSQETKNVSPNVPQQWDFYVPLSVGTGTAYQQQGTMKLTVVFDKDGKAINISVNGTGVGNTPICGNMIQLGQTQDQIKAACGTPGFVNKQEPTDASGKPVQDKVVTYTYNSNPPVTMTFENGILKSTSSK